MTSAFTPNLGLEKPDPSQPIDVTKLNGNMDMIDKSGTIPVFANATLRDSAFAVAPFKLCVVGASYDAGILMVRRNGLWFNVGGQAVGAGQLSSSQTTANATTTEVKMDVISTYSNATLSNINMLLTSGRIVVPFAGWYNITGRIQWAINTNGYRIIYIALNGTIQSVHAIQLPVSPASTTSLNVTGMMYLSAGTGVSLGANQNSGGPLDINAGILEVIQVA